MNCSERSPRFTTMQVVLAVLPLTVTGLVACDAPRPAGLTPDAMQQAADDTQAPAVLGDLGSTDAGARTADVGAADTNTVGPVTDAAAKIIKARRVANINTTQPTKTSVGSRPQSFAALGGITLFVASTPQTGKELWRTDGTPAGTRIVADLYPGSWGSSPTRPRVWRGLAYFFARNETNARGLWVSDGTAANTRLLAPLPDGEPYGSMVMGEDYFYFSSGGLWRSDGSKAGTRRLNSVKGTIQDLALAGDTVFFGSCTRGDGEHRFELWASKASTQSVPTRLTQHTIFGRACDRMLLPVGSKVVFVGSSAANGAEPWVSDGTEAGTQLLKDVRAGEKGSMDAGFKNTLVVGGIHRMAHVGSSAFFTANDGQHGKETWITDGTPDGTRLWRDLNPGQGSVSVTYTVVDDALFIAARVGRSQQLWTADGKTGATQLRSDQHGEPCGFVEDGRLTYYWAQATDAKERALWQTDGTAEGTRLAAAGPYPASVMRRCAPGIENGGTAFFSGTDEFGSEPWVSDGTTDGTRRLANLARGEQSAFSFGTWTQPLARAGDTLVMLADDGKNGQQLWASDGSEAGTQKLSTFGPQLHFAQINPFTNLDGQVVFRVGQQQWQSDGTAEGTQPTGDLVFSPTAMGGASYFSASLGSPDYTCRLMRRDISSGTLTEIIRFDGKQGCIGSRAAYGPRVYFTKGHWTGSDLYVTDGTPGGTKRVVSQEGDGFSYLSRMTVVGGKLFFFEKQKGRVLWAIDGLNTPPKEVMRWDDQQLVAEDVVFPLGDQTNLFYFAMLEPAYSTARAYLHPRRSIWRSDGTAAGTIAL